KRFKHEFLRGRLYKVGREVRIVPWVQAYCTKVQYEVRGWSLGCETSCGAADRVKPRARLCEPWVMVSYLLRAATRRQRAHNIRSRRLPVIAVAPFGAQLGSLVDPRLAKPRLGLNSARCSTAW